MKKRNAQKWIGSVLGALLLALLSLHFLFFLFGDRILKKSVLVAVNRYVSYQNPDASVQPSLDFGHLRFNLFSGNLVITDIEFRSGQSVAHNTSKVFIQELEIDGINLWEIYQKEVSLNHIRLQQPSIHFSKKIAEDTISKDVGEWLSIISSNLQHTVQEYLRSLSVDKLNVQDANVAVYFLDSLEKPLDTYTPTASHYYANHLHLAFTNFLLDSTTQHDEGRILFSENAEARLSDFQMMLPDSSYLCKADTLAFSTFNQRFYLKQVEILPVKAAQQSEEHYFHATIPEVELTHLNIEEIFFDSLLKVHEFHIDQPHIQVYGNFDRSNSVQISSLGLRKLDPDSLYSLISHKLSHLSVNYFKLREGKLNVFDRKNDSASLLEVEQLSLAFNDFLLNRSITRTKVDSLNNVLPMDSILFELGGVKISMPDKVHSLTSNFLSLQTDRKRRYRCNFLLDSVHIRPEVGSLKSLFDQSPSSVQLGYDISFQKVLLYDIDLEDLSKRKLIFMDSIVFQKPIVNVANFSGIPFGALIDDQKNPDPNQHQSIKEILYNWSQARLDFHPIVAPGRSTALFYGIYVDHIHIDSGKVYLQEADTKAHTFHDIASLGYISAYIRQARIDNIGNSIQAMGRGYSDYKVAVHATDFDVYLENGILLLPDDDGPTALSTLQFASAGFSTATSEGSVKKLYIWPNKSATASSRNQIRRIFLPYVILSGFDFDRFYNQQQAHIQRLLIHSPQVMLAIDEKQAVKKVRQSEITVQNLFQWIDPYANAVSLQDLDIRDAKVAVERRIAEQKDFNDFISAEALNLKVKQFYLDSASRITRKKPLYAEYTWIEAKDYKLNFSLDPLQDFISVRGKTLDFSTYNHQLQLRQLMIAPHADASKNQYVFHIEKIQLDYANLYDYLKYDQLLLNRLSIGHPKGKVVSRAAKKKEAVVTDKLRVLQPDLYPYIKDFVTRLKVDDLRLERGEIEFVTLGQGTDTTQYILADTVLLTATDFLIDAHQRGADKMWYADQVDFNIHLDRYSLQIAHANQQLKARNIVLTYSDSLVRAEHVVFHPLSDTTSQGSVPDNPDPQYDISIPLVVMTRVDFEKAFLQGDVNLKRLTFVQPEISAFHHRPSVIKQPKTFREILGNYISTIKIDQIAVKEGELKSVYYPSDGSQLSKISIGRVDAYLNKFYLDEQAYTEGEKSSNSNDIHHRLFADELVVKVKDYQHKLGDSLHTLKAAAVDFSTKKSSLVFTSLELVPRYDKDDIIDNFTYQKTWAYCRIPILSVLNVDIDKMVQEGAFKADMINVKSPHLVLFKDKRLPRNLSQIRPMPQDMLMTLNLPVTIDSVKIFDGFISYEERIPAADRDGKLTFEKLDASLSNITNDPVLVKSNTLMGVEANAYLLGKNYLELILHFHLGSPESMFSAQGSIGPMDLTQLNVILEPLAFLHINRGISKGMDFQFVGNKEVSAGAMRFNYNDLHVLLVDKTTGGAGLDERVGSFLANTFVLKADNPTANFLRIGKIEHERDETRSFFHHLWQSVLSGIKSSVGMEKHADKTRDFTSLE